MCCIFIDGQASLCLGNLLELHLKVPVQVHAPFCSAFLVVFMVMVAWLVTLMFVLQMLHVHVHLCMCMCKLVTPTVCGR